jgi:hypothetical protein
MKNPEQQMQESLDAAKSAAADNVFLHLSQAYTKAPGQAAVVLCFVTCPDTVAADVKEAVDVAVRAVFADHGLKIRNPQ